MTRRQRTIEATHYLLAAALQRRKVPSFAAYPFNLPAVRHLRSLRFHPAVTFLIGENGSGKSTLLEAIAVAWGFNPEGGSINFRFNTRTSHSDVHEFLRLERGLHRPKDGFFLRAESFFNLATQIETLDRETPGLERFVIDAYGGRSLHEQSHGESFLALLTQRFRGHGLYLLDEPEAALSPTRQMALVTRIHDLVERQSQFIIATHSPIIMAYPNAQIVELADDGPRRVTYTETEHYAVTKQFLNHHERMLRMLTTDPDDPPAGT